MSRNTLPSRWPRARPFAPRNQHAVILGPACSTFDWPFLEAFLKSGVLKYLDGVSVHPYREAAKGPEQPGRLHKAARHD